MPLTELGKWTSSLARNGLHKSHYRRGPEQHNDLRDRHGKIVLGGPYLILGLEWLRKWNPVIDLDARSEQ